MKTEQNNASGDETQEQPGDGNRKVDALVRQFAQDEKRAWGELWEAKFSFTDGQTEEQAQRFACAAKHYAELVAKLIPPNKVISENGN